MTRWEQWNQGRSTVVTDAVSPLLGGSDGPSVLHHELATRGVRVAAGSQPIFEKEHPIARSPKRRTISPELLVNVFFLLVSHVCKAWRTMAFDSPFAWSQLVLIENTSGTTGSSHGRRACIWTS
ncbi:hypothetical protein DAEQUDRAFT_733140 [Daedalea quercina L-15889]|uniref:F-box domain-containing protein n=1 Tax=Daedalea quercina L-15889 TaxID=1314783 RepID=A0A165L7E5_9APHY|nr:hypothetical protein DAEQUDRAFT_733140 [Daedalea quercina L-15889]